MTACGAFECSAIQIGTPKLSNVQWIVSIALSIASRRYGRSRSTPKGNGRRSAAAALVCAGSAAAIAASATNEAALTTMIATYADRVSSPSASVPIRAPTVKPTLRTARMIAIVRTRSARATTRPTSACSNGGAAFSTTPSRHITIKKPARSCTSTKAAKPAARHRLTTTSTRRGPYRSARAPTGTAVRSPRAPPNASPKPTSTIDRPTERVKKITETARNAPEPEPSTSAMSARRRTAGSRCRAAVAHVATIRTDAPADLM